MCKVKGNKGTANYIGISVRSISRKLFARVVTEKLFRRLSAKLRMRRVTKRNQGCVDQVFGLKEVCKMHLKKGDLYETLMDLKKVCDKIDRNMM